MFSLPLHRTLFATTMTKCRRPRRRRCPPHPVVRYSLFYKACRKALDLPELRDQQVRLYLSDALSHTVLSWATVAGAYDPHQDFIHQQKRVIKFVTNTTPPPSALPLSLFRNYLLLSISLQKLNNNQRFTRYYQKKKTEPPEFRCDANDQKNHHDHPPIPPIHASVPIPSTPESAIESAMQPATDSSTAIRLDITSLTSMVNPSSHHPIPSTEKPAIESESAIDFPSSIEIESHHTIESESHSIEDFPSLTHPTSPTILSPPSTSPPATVNPSPHHPSISQLTLPSEPAATTRNQSPSHNPRPCSRNCNPSCNADCFICHLFNWHHPSVPCVWANTRESRSTLPHNTSYDLRPSFEFEFCFEDLEKMRSKDPDTTKKFNPEDASQSSYSQSSTSTTSINSAISIISSSGKKKYQKPTYHRYISKNLGKTMLIYGSNTQNGRNASQKKTLELHATYSNRQLYILTFTENTMNSF